MSNFSAIAIRLEGNSWWVLSAPGCPEALDPGDDAFPEIRPGLKAHPDRGDRKLPAIVLDETAEGGTMIRLLETQRYEWGVTGAQAVEVTSTLESLPSRQWSVRRMGMLSGSFTVVNHLGMADFTLVLEGRPHRFPLEIVSAKLDYHTEFRQITEDIADFCQQVLLNWDAPTSLGFAVDPEHAARLALEQFLFLRSHLPPERLEELIESIQRRPNSRLVRDASWTPLSGAGSTDWLRNPVGMARDWRQIHPGARRLPAQVQDVRKEDSLDTAANRFVKFALSQFRELCREVVEKHGAALTLAREARELGNTLETVLSRPFFREQGTLARLPLDNPTLQKRDGYREILRAWLLTQAAAALKWDREEDSYHGPTRNVATLYEYWIFLQLHQMLDEIPGVFRDLKNPKPAEDAEPFLQMKNGEVTIHLKRGSKTCAPFTVRLSTGMVLKIHLYYERTFQMRDGATDATSYSRQFKPDYTLAIFPARFPEEADAAAAGKIAFVHFDAKYRAENLKQIFGELDQENELDLEKQDAKATSTYQRGDLLKMHTYNDAVRQTAGSYVLYPGSDEAARLRKFHEILPGVGAFVLKPGNPGCRDTLKDFLLNVFTHQADQFTQFRHFSDVQHAVVREVPTVHRGASTHRPGAACILVFVKQSIREVCREKRLVYCRAIREDGSPVPIKLGNMAGAVLCPYSAQRASDSFSLGWQAGILSCEMLSLGSLRRILQNEGWPLAELPQNASAYLLFHLDNPADAKRRVISALTPRATYEAVSSTLRKLDECHPVHH